MTALAPTLRSDASEESLLLQEEFCFFLLSMTFSLRRADITRRTLQHQST
jgi:hypothetical protein